MTLYKHLANSVKIECRHNKPIIVDQAELLHLAGVGRSAFVFKIKNTNKAMKVYFPDLSHIAKEEADVYRIVQQIDHYPAIYESGPNYIVIDYIEGHTFFECLTLGIPIFEENIKEVDSALSLAREHGLNPSDIHLRNIFITSEGDIKLIDLARFRQSKTCNQWADLKRTFYGFYKRSLFPKRIPAPLLNIIAFCYKSFYRKKLLPITLGDYAAKARMINESLEKD